MKLYEYKTAEVQGERCTTQAREQTPGLLERWLIGRLRSRIDGNRGTLQLRLPSGNCYRFGDRQPFASLTLNNYRALRKLITGGLNGWSEAYLQGDWDSPDLTALIQWGARYEHSLESMGRLRLLSDLQHNRYHRSRDNHREGSRRNIAAHYDLGNAFYRQWLDPSMTYSAALFSEPTMSLQEAQGAKNRRILELTQTQPGDRICEIGCGWGGFAEQTAQAGRQVHGVTLSKEQLAWAQQRIRSASLDAQVELSLTDYRDLDGQYDAVVSIEMFEAVGERHWDTYFEQLKRILKPEGRAVLQIITIDDQRFHSYRKQADFIQRYIFPGGMLPSVEALRHKFNQHGLRLEHQQMFGLDYARTLKHWAEAFERNYTNIEAQGFDRHFYRMWRYYLAYCEGGFREKCIDVGLFVLTRA
ncbi:cyclopropane-fatty-acyl-phospholipid synthase family protein [Marinobacterium sp. D7]|uniref:SAM-dependent methyltransferase n=1 Tax=Marinobacterium ramblicola TaxID=2849041 RepID=UPI001C2D3DE0|nr:cyclopropane-fatty-acyl-phospholipid synthase family protein [Marinobacterium ramblicola]MBV1788162.1 cyclopropane-fatty-acyl-phospholipid synthase family protein [Marinobacterium ramblicola]